MGVCDAHGAIWQSDKQLSAGEGYLLGARFVQRSVIQDKMIDRDMPMMQMFGMTREKYRLQLEMTQGTSPWLICDKCIGVLNLSPADKDLARQAARRFATNPNTPGHDPGSKSPTRSKKPSYFMIVGNGFTPTEREAKDVMLAWLHKRKGIFGQDAVVDVPSVLESRPKANRLKFFEIVEEVQRKNPGHAIDDLLRLEQQTGKDLALIAVWPPEDATFIQGLLKKQPEAQAAAKKVDRPAKPKKWWAFWK